jgi:hypothetical protein
MTAIELPALSGAEVALRGPETVEQPGDERVPPTRISMSRRMCERGMVTAEWAIGVIAAVSLAGLLLALVLHGPLKDLISNIVISIIKHVAGTAGV